MIIRSTNQAQAFVEFSGNFFFFNFECGLVENLGSGKRMERKGKGGWMDRLKEEELAQAVMYDLLSYCLPFASEDAIRQNGRGEMGASDPGRRGYGMARPERMRALRPRDGGRMEA